MEAGVPVADSTLATTLARTRRCGALLRLRRALRTLSHIGDARGSLLVAPSSSMRDVLPLLVALGVRGEGWTHSPSRSMVLRPLPAAGAPALSALLDAAAAAVEEALAVRHEWFERQLPITGEPSPFHRGFARADVIYRDTSLKRSRS